MILTPLIGGKRIRLRLSNRFGSTPMRLGEVRVARAANGATVEPGSSRQLSFGGMPGVTLGPGEDITSDATVFDFRRFEKLAVSIYVDPASSGQPTRHFDGLQTSYLTADGTGDHTADASGDAFSVQDRSRYLLSGLDVRASRRTGSVVAFGDSLTAGLQDQATDGSEPSVDHDVRYPDFLSRRLGRKPGPQRLSVLNAGISGNKLTGGFSYIELFGLPAPLRLKDDALRQPGVRNVILLEGSNDLASNQSARPIITALRDLIRRLERSRPRLKTFLGTLPPNQAAGVQANERHRLNAMRSKINDWIRHQHAADGYIDFYRVLNDPVHPKRLDPRFDSGDHLHPSTAGFKAMAHAVPLRRLASGCRTR